jgi:hypothetical protein
VDNFVTLKELDNHQLNATEIMLLTEIEEILSLFHTTQELLSSERTPTLAVSLPAYELILQGLSNITRSDRFRNLHHAIFRSMDKIQKYVDIARTNPVYAMAMCTSLFTLVYHG